MPEPIKLKNPGDAHTMDVASCAKVPVGKYPEWELTGRDGSKARMMITATRASKREVGSVKGWSEEFIRINARRMVCPMMCEQRFL